MLCSLVQASAFSVYQGGIVKIVSSYLDSHFREDFCIEEVGMKLTPENKSKIRLRLDSLDSRAPSNSCTYLKFTNEKGKIKGELSITGAGKMFESELIGIDPWELYKSLEIEVDKQLSQWKKTRFLEMDICLNQQTTRGTV